MIAVFVCGQDKRELTLIDRSCREQIARRSEEPLQLERAAEDGALAAAVAAEKPVDLLYYEFRKGQAVEELRTFRRRYGETRVMLITDPSISPLEYLRPGIAPDSLMLRPLTGEQLDTVNAEFMDSFFERFNRKETESCFLVDTREEKIFIPFFHIYYFEARDKKLFLRTKNEEYAFYSTIESLEKQLPEQFRRCHRSYIVNLDKIVRIRPGESCIELNDQLGVPISRSYKSEFKGVWS